MMTGWIAVIGGAAGTVALFLAATALYRRTRLFLLHPVLVTITTIILLLLIAGIPYEQYNRGGRLISLFLEPAVVALGLPLYRQWPAIRRQARAILMALVIGSIAGIVTAAGLALALAATPEVVLSLAPRSVTAPIAIGISEATGGVPALAAAVAIASGILGAIIGPPLLRIAGIRSPTAFGLALGAASHGIGTARALEEGEAEGAAAGLSIALMGAVTAALLPLIVAGLFALFALPG
jgi:predicted murein hydrolase (TIGR00659 family)